MSEHRCRLTSERYRCDCYEEGMQRGTREAEARIVEWLRTSPTVPTELTPLGEFVVGCRYQLPDPELYASAIDRGEHRKEGGR